MQESVLSSSLDPVARSGTGRGVAMTDSCYGRGRGVAVTDSRCVGQWPVPTYSHLSSRAVSTALDGDLIYALSVISQRRLFLSHHVASAVDEPRVS